MSTELGGLIQPEKKAYLVGIGGVGMSALARVLAGRGLQVRGSDMRRSKTVSELELEGIRVERGHRGDFQIRPDLVIFSSAVSKTNPDLVSARASGIPVFHRAEVLSFMMNQGISIAITGTHGKTTCSAFTAFLMTETGLRPTCLIGGKALNYGTNAILGSPHFFVAEVDESDRSHLRFSPDLALITGLEAEHLDVYSDIEDLKQSFRNFVDQVQKTGRVVYNFEDPHIRDLMGQIRAEALSYGLTPGADLCAADIELYGFASSYQLQDRGRKIGTVKLSIPGLHNVANSLGVIGVLRSFGLGYDRFLHLLQDFRGAARRLEVKLNRPELMVIDDYAHHPSEVRASLSALRSLGRKTTAVFQPHRFSRTSRLASEFSEVFASADRVLLTDIYGAGEENTSQVSTEVIYDAVKKSGHKDVQMVGRSEVLRFLSSRPTDGEIVIFMGAGDIGEIADEFASQFEGAYLQR